MPKQGRFSVMAVAGLLLGLFLSGCASGIVRVSKDTLIVYERAGERLRRHHETLEETLNALAITEKASRRNQLRWEGSVETLRLEHEYTGLIRAAQPEEKPKLRQEAMLRIAALSETYRRRIEAVDSEVEGELAQLLKSHETLVKLNGELLANQGEIHRCLETDIPAMLKKGVRLDFSPAKSQCFVDVGRLEQLIKTGRELLNELQKIREKNEKG